METQSPSPRREKIRRIIFEADTPAGKLYDVLLIVVVALSVLVVMLDSVSGISAVHHSRLQVAEWILTILFTADYIVRLVCIGRPRKYALSFFGIVDLLSILPTYLELIVPGSRFLAVIRFLRVLRTFRVLKLSSYQEESRLLIRSFRASRRRIAVFLFFVMSIVVVLGALMYVVEGEANGFTSIPRSIYWAIVTLTTVGYGDVSPQTALGQGIAALIMIMGYSLIVVPTGIVSSAMAVDRPAVSPRPCASCGQTGHDSDATYCKACGTALS